MRKMKIGDKLALMKAIDKRNAESVKRYNEAVKQIKKMREEESKKERAGK